MKTFIKNNAVFIFFNSDGYAVKFPVEPKGWEKREIYIIDQKINNYVSSGSQISTKCIPEICGCPKIVFGLRGGSLYCVIDGYHATRIETTLHARNQTAMNKIIQGMNNQNINPTILSKILSNGDFILQKEIEKAKRFST